MLCNASIVFRLLNNDTFFIVLTACPPGMLQRGNQCYKHLVVDSTGYSFYIYANYMKDVCKRFNSYGSTGMTVGSNDGAEQSFLYSMAFR